jgi:alkylation response protein AidB-like acyl-CoA dehydrogenase
MALARQGWLAPGWPREHGGMGLSPAKQVIFIEELERHGAPRTNDMGITMIGPLLIRYGTEAQRARFLPPILAGEHIWCQGYSEPNAGSDLASLRTEAVLEGDHYVVNGSKIWTTLANDANWIFLLVRTDRSAKKQDGISFLLARMDSPGITVRPIVTLDRHDEFCEVFLDDVRVPAENLVGEPNRGWTMAKALLGFERIFLGSPKQSTYALAKLAQVAEHMGVADDPVFADRFTRLRMDLEDLKALYETQVAKLRRGEELGAEVSMLKVWQSELFQRITETALEIAGEEGVMVNPIGGNRTLNPGSAFIQSRVVSIYGGSNEIQRNIIAKTMLGLPG